jgi:hypothetical protein
VVENHCFDLRLTIHRELVVEKYRNFILSTTDEKDLTVNGKQEYFEVLQKKNDF